MRYSWIVDLSCLVLFKPTWKSQKNEHCQHKTSKQFQVLHFVQWFAAIFHHKHHIIAPDYYIFTYIDVVFWNDISCTFSAREKGKIPRHAAMPGKSPFCRPQCRWLRLSRCQWNCSASLSKPYEIPNEGNGIWEPHSGFVWALESSPGDGNCFLGGKFRLYGTNRQNFHMVHRKKKDQDRISWESPQNPILRLFLSHFWGRWWGVTYVFMFWKHDWEMCQEKVPMSQHLFIQWFHSVVDPLP